MTGASARAFFLFACFVALVAPWVSATAQERVRTGGISNRLHITQFHHRMLLAADGAPGRVTDIAQDREGYLWMTSQNGLYRFDGVHFDQTLSRRLPSQMIKGLFLDTDGSMWLSYYFGGVTHVSGERIETYKNSLPPGTVFAFAKTPDGVLWAASAGGLSTYAHGAWHPVDSEHGYDGSALRALSQSKDGRLWITTVTDRSYVLSLGSSHFEPVDQDTVRTQLRGLPASLPVSLLDADPTPFIDSAGALWLPSDKGIQRYRWSAGAGEPPVREDFTPADGLSDGTVSAFFEDRDSNIWVATALGIDQFRESRITPHEVDDHLFMPAIAFDNDGDAWVGTTWGAYRLTPDSTRFPELGQYFSCVARDRLGNVWMAGQSGLFHIVRGKISRITGPTEEPSAVTRYQSIAVDGAGALWVAVSGLGLYRRDGSRWSSIKEMAGLATDRLTRLVSDTRGRLWIAFGDGHLARKDGDHVKLFGPGDGLAIGAIADMALERGNALVGGESGLAQIIEDRFVSLYGTERHAFSGITGIVQLKNGELWLQADEGVIRISSEEMQQVAARPDHEVRYEVYDAEDGLIGQADKVRPLPSLAEGRDDRVWITTTREVASVNTRHLLRNRTVAKPEVWTVLAEGVLYEASSRVSLPPLTRSMRIDFGAPTLTMPARTTFQARLVGVDETWQNLGTRREAFYTNLGPGDYQFELQVTNEDGMVGVMDHPLLLRIQPAFYQTVWFRLAVGLFLIVALAVLYRWRLRLANQRSRIQLEERERIAREVHDTLLQSIHGLLFTVESVVRSDVIGETSRPTLSQAVEKARKVAAEGRDRVSALRMQSDDAECPLEDFMEFLDDSGEDTFYVTTIEGRIRRLKVAPGQEVVAILREALHNARNHADAAQISLRIRYGYWNLVVEVRDDGRGITQGLLKLRQHHGHWGITGMRERARQIGGHLALVTEEGIGTCVTLTVPARLIYRRRSTH
ncbi:hypothetical protein FIV34_00155 [Luteibacter pinisoli]|uniref:Histidine kinase/HSP90-like ATPase domain-containing protein n=1 Tax=Luteibacter pinisoli TaxID=2589080 RepID=A0A4Y5YZC9_9GAMM|nr:sensor histidine kinase [Luteibacter pinisoli]QDE37719.1 hypothetical protein FIV34_00155 [Luteibacter pinisoli]